MTSEAKHHTSGRLELAIALAAIAGFVDAFVYLHVTSVFVANMSGNLIHLGVAAGGHNGRSVFTTCIALLGFVGGVMMATSRVDSGLRAGRSPSPAALLRFEALLLVALPVVMIVGDVTYSASSIPIDDVLVAIGAMSMGIQAVALRRVGQVAVSTTYGTGAIVRLGEKLALAMRRTDHPGDVRRRTTIAVLATVLVGYVGGAWIAATLSSAPAWLFIPAGATAVASIFVGARRRENSGEIRLT